MAGDSLFGAQFVWDAKQATAGKGAKSGTGLQHYRVLAAHSPLVILSKLRVLIAI